MSKLENLPGRALELVTQIGDGIKQKVPDRALNGSRPAPRSAH